MLNFLKRIRRKLVEGAKFRNYLFYAMGEITLIVIGILIALQVNNWNESRRTETRLRTVLEQLYNSIKIDIETTVTRREMADDDIDNLNSLIYDLDSQPDSAMVSALYNIENLGLSYNSESETYISRLNLDVANPEQLNLLKQITNYIDGNIYQNFYRESDYLSVGQLFDQYAIPRPGSITGEEILDDTYTPEDIAAIRALLKSKEGVAHLKNIKMERAMFLEASTSYISDGKTIMDLIRGYMPGVRLIYQDVGIVGTATAGGWNQSTPMELTDEQNSIWELKTTLSDGFVKFRTRNSWTQNWGGNAFPRGRAIYYGKNIKVDPGMYHISLNLNENRYEFRKMEQE